MNNLHEKDKFRSPESARHSQIVQNYLEEQERPLNKQVSFARYLSVVDKEEDEEDHNLRDQKMKEMINEFLAKSEYRYFKAYFIDQTAFDDARPEPPKSIRTEFERILSYCQITLDVVTMSNIDSAIRITPATDLTAINYYLGVLLPELPTFPYSFYHNFRIGKFTMCGDITLESAKHKHHFESKFYGWNFMIDRQQTPEQIRRHFYHTVCFNLMKIYGYEEFDYTWSKLTHKVPEYVVNLLIEQEEHPEDHVDDKINPKFKQGFLSARCMIDPLLDKLEVFYMLVNQPDSVIYHEDKIICEKANLLKDLIERFDPEGITVEWWRERGLTPKK